MLVCVNDCVCVDVAVIVVVVVVVGFFLLLCPFDGLSKVLLLKREVVSWLIRNFKQTLSIHLHRWCVTDFVDS